MVRNRVESNRLKYVSTQRAESAPRTCWSLVMAIGIASIEQITFPTSVSLGRCPVTITITTNIHKGPDSVSVREHLPYSGKKSYVSQICGLMWVQTWSYFYIYHVSIDSTRVSLLYSTSPPWQCHSITTEIEPTLHRHR